MPGSALDFTAPFEIKSAADEVVLEIQEQGSKAMKDAAPTSVGSLWTELEESGLVDCTLSCHEVSRASLMEVAVSADWWCILKALEHFFGG